jgi:hypothetical protein
VLVVAVTIGVLAAVIPPTDFNKDAGRWGGLIWRVIERTPDLMNRSVIMVVLASIGAVIIAAVATRSSAPGAHGWKTTLACAALAGTAALSANSQAWERYVDLPLQLLRYGGAARTGLRANCGCPSCCLQGCSWR